jgi:predicted metal-dependent hydrolase
MEKLAYTLVRSRRRTLALQVEPDGALTVRAPLRCSNRDIERFVALHADWAAEKSAEARARRAAHPAPTPAQREALFEQTRALVVPLVARWSAQMDLHPTGIKITGAERRFGSCSGKDSLCFSYRLAGYPAEAVEYVVVHELAHIAEKNHGPRFYALVASVLPDYRAREKLLRQ